MSKKRNNSCRSRITGNSAKKDQLLGKSLPGEVGNPAEKAVPVQSEASAPEVLEMVCPNPFGGFEPLTDYAARFLTAKVIGWLDRLCKDRGARVDLAYWKSCT